MNNVDLTFSSDASGLLYYDLTENQSRLNVKYKMKKMKTVDSSESLQTDSSETQSLDSSEIRWKIKLIFNFILSGNTGPECSIKGIFSQGDRVRFISSEETNAPEVECYNLNPVLSLDLFGCMARYIFLEVSADEGMVLLKSRYLKQS